MIVAVVCFIVVLVVVVDLVFVPSRVKEVSEILDSNRYWNSGFELGRVGFADSQTHTHTHPPTESLCVDSLRVTTLSFVAPPLRSIPFRSIRSFSSITL